MLPLLCHLLLLGDVCAGRGNAACVRVRALCVDSIYKTGIEADLSAQKVKLAHVDAAWTPQRRAASGASSSYDLNTKGKWSSQARPTIGRLQLAVHCLRI